jgi:hypothetical protein
MIDVAPFRVASVPINVNLNEWSFENLLIKENLVPEVNSKVLS